MAEKTDTEQPLEEALWYDLTEAQQFPTILVLGQKGSGKTHFCLKLIHRLLKESNFKKFHICSPIARFEQNDSYAFLNKWAPDKAGEFPTDKRVYIYPKFKDSLLAAIMARDMRKDPSDLLLWIDDASAGDSRALSQSRYLGDLVSTSRHRRVALILCNHSTTAVSGGAQVGVLGPFTRQQASYVALMRVGNSKLLESFWEEFQSLVECRDDETEHQKWVAFRNLYNTHTCGKMVNGHFDQSHEGIILSCLSGYWDRNVKSYFDKFEPPKGRKKRAREDTDSDEGGL